MLLISQPILDIGQSDQVLEGHQIVMQLVAQVAELVAELVVGVD